jgi:hypothetical protein
MVILVGGGNKGKSSRKRMQAQLKRLYAGERTKGSYFSSLQSVGAPAHRPAPHTARIIDLFGVGSSFNL